MEEKANIQQELRECAPYLASLSRNHPFTVPEKYFTNLEKRMVSEVSENVTSIHENLLLNKEHPFEVPEDYFGNLSQKILKTINEKENRYAAATPAHFTLHYKKYRIWLAAASVSVIFAISSIIVWNGKKTAVTVPAQQATAPVAVMSEDAKFLSENISDVDESLVYQIYLDQSYADNAASKSTAKKAVKHAPSNKDVKEYENYLLDARDIDPDIIENSTYINSNKF